MRSVIGATQQSTSQDHPQGDKLKNTAPTRRAILLTAAAVILVSMWPSLPPWDALIGDPLGETDNHVWMFWRQVRWMVEGVMPLSNAPAGVPIPLMDPVNLPMFAALSIFGPTVAYNGLALWSVILAMAGGYALSRQFTGRQGAVVGMASAGSAPFLLGVIDFGITESWTLGWMGLHAAALIAYSRTGRTGLALLSGVTLGAVALSGWYHALLGLVIEAVLVSALLWRHRRVGIVLQGLIGAAMVTPALVRFLEVRGQWEVRWLSPPPGPPGPRPDWAELPVYGTDLLNLFLPQLTSVHPSKAVYLGLVTLALVAIGLVKRWRVALLPVAVALPPLVLALGYWPTVAGTATGFPGPAWFLVRAFEPLAGLSHWHRAVAAAVPFIAAAAAIGADALPRRAFVGPVLAMLIVIDATALSQTAWPRPAYIPELPPSLDEIPGEGGLVQIPFDNSREMFSEDPARIYSRWQPIHGRMISENYEGMDALLAESKVVAASHAACWNRDNLPPYYKPPPEMRGLEPLTDLAVIAGEREQLRAWGYRWLILHRERCRVPARAIPAMESMFGPSTTLSNGDLLWEL
ncbi:MAG: hypothetical protein ACI8RZ_006480 [Myxococcota bacterium]|jgi:hypothetical protein